jgi:hypothetical protein
MNLKWHEIIRVLDIGVPLLVMGLWGWSQKRRAKENEKTSSVLRRREP